MHSGLFASKKEQSESEVILYETLKALLHREVMEAQLATSLATRIARKVNKMGRQHSIFPRGRNGTGPIINVEVTPLPVPLKNAEK